MIRELPDETEINLGQIREKPNRVMVDNPHDYKDLLKMSAKELVQQGNLYPNEVLPFVDTTLKHEKEHSVPALDNDGLEVKYSVEFVKDTKGGRNFSGIRPAVVLGGKTKLGTFKDIVDAPTDKSETDKITLGKK